MDAVQGSIRGDSYHIMDIKEPDYVVLLMTTYGMLEYLEGSDTQRRYKGAGGEFMTKQFNYCEFFGDHFNYRHQVDDNNNCRHSPISDESTWATKYWPYFCHDYCLAFTEVNTNHLRGYLFNGIYLEPQLIFGASWDRRWSRTHLMKR